MIVLFYKGLTRNLEMRNTPVRGLPNIWRLGQVRDTKFGTNVSNKMLLNAAKARVTAFTISELLREKQQVGGAWGVGRAGEGGEGEITPHPDYG